MAIFSIAESCAIVSYLAETYGKRDRPLIPCDGRQRARLHEWNYFISMELDATALYPMRRHSILKHIYGDAPAAVELSKAYFLKQLDHVDQTLQASGQFLMGEEFTIADILLTTCLTWAIALEVPVHDALPRISGTCHGARLRIRLLWPPINANPDGNLAVRA